MTKKKKSIDIFVSKYKASNTTIQAYRLFDEYRANYDEDMTKNIFYRELNKFFKKRVIRVFNKVQGINTRKVAFLMEKK